MSEFTPEHRLFVRGGCWDFSRLLAPVSLTGPGSLAHIQRTPSGYSDMFCGVRLARRAP